MVAKARLVELLFKLKNLSFFVLIHIMQMGGRQSFLYLFRKLMQFILESEKELYGVLNKYKNLISMTSFSKNTNQKSTNKNFK